jgi:SAM-dependent methyltransferase
MTPPIRVRRVDDAGLSVVALVDRPVDVCIDGRRVWTFWTRRDTTAVGFPTSRSVWPVRHADWPGPLRRHLDGRGRITVRDSAGGSVLYDDVLALGAGDGPIRVQNDAGVELGIDKSGRLVPTFAGRSSEDIAALLDAVEAVLGALRHAGLEPFLAYGTLLGAVREGAVLGHDSDADLGYVSRFTDPVDVARESFRVQRLLAAEGWRITRYSGAAFKIDVTEADVTRGLDVFGGFLDAGRLYLMGEIGAPFERQWIFPLGTADLEGRPMPVPARPERLLEATYGPAWRVPDPAFRFETPDRTVRALNDWFRGTQPGIRHWERRASVMSDKPVRNRPTPLAQLVHDSAVELDAEVLDVGAGRGADALWLARQGLAVTAYDYVVRGLQPAVDRARAEGVDLTARHLNLTEWRSVLAEGARLAHAPRPRVVMAQHVVDATSGVGRQALARLCSMALRTGGRLHAEFHAFDGAGAGPAPDVEDLDDVEDGKVAAGARPRGARVRDWPDWLVGFPRVEEFEETLRRAGAHKVDVAHGDLDGRPVVRVMGEW